MVDVSRRMSAYAAKIAAETLRSEPSSDPDLSDSGILVRLSGCGRPARLEDVPAIRAAFLAEYGAEREMTAQGVGDFDPELEEHNRTVRAARDLGVTA